MKQWMRRARGALGIGLTWAAGWAVFGVMLGASSILLPGLPWDAFFEVFDAPLPALAIPGFVGGILFSAVLGIAGRHRKFHELSLLRFAAWGALGGLLLSLVPDAMVAVGLASLGDEGRGLLELTAIIAPPFIVLSAISAAGSFLIARRAEGSRSLPADGRMGAVLAEVAPVAAMPRGPVMADATPADRERSERR